MIKKYKKLSEESIKNYVERFTSAFKNINQNAIDKLKFEILKRVNTSQEIFLIGNGGSAANANHIAGDFLKTFSSAGLTLKISSLCENSCYITATSNDEDFSEVYEILVNTRISKGDLVIFLSGSGNSLNLIKTAISSKKNYIRTAAIIGFQGGALKDMVDIPIHLEIDDMEISEDAQMTIFHYLKQSLLKDFINIKEKTSKKYKKRTNEGLIA